MHCKNGILAGSLLLVAGIVDVLGIAFGGSFESGLVWNLAVFLFGLLLIVSAYFVQKALNSKVFSLLLAVAGIGAIGAALFCGCYGLLLSLVGDKPLLYYPFAVVGYLALGFCGITSFKFTRQPFSIFCVGLGLFSLIVFRVWISTFDISYSGTRMLSILVDYSQSLWVVVFAAYLIGENSTVRTGR